MAECSLSTGKSLTPAFLTSSRMISPAATSGSLFAIAISLPERMAATVGRIPHRPINELRSMSASDSSATVVTASSPISTRVSVSDTRIRNSSPASRSTTATSFGENSRICSSKSFMFEYAASAVMGIFFSRATSIVCVPIDPVEPKSASFFMVSPILCDDYRVINNEII